MTAISATEVRSNFSEILGRVAYGKERVTIERRGRPLAVLLPLEDLARLEAGIGGGPAGASNILRAVADNIPGTVYQRIQYPDGREEYSYVSPGIHDAFGIESKAMISDPTTLSRAIHPEDRERRARAIAESARTLSTYDVQYRVRTPAGETKWLHAIARPERRADGAIAWTGVILDATKGKETEAALGESEARYRDIVENVGDLIQSIGPDGKYLFVNQAWKDILGYSDAEAKTMSFADVVHPDDMAHCDEIFEGLEDGRSFENVSVLFVARDGREIAVEGHLSSVMEAGQLVRTRAIFRDVTERRKTEAALRESEKRYRSLYDSIPLSVWEEDWSEVKKMIDRLAAEGVSDWETYFERHGDEVVRAFDLCKTLNINAATRQMYRAPNEDNALDLILGQPVVEAESRKFASWLASFARGDTAFVGECEEPRVDGTTFEARVRSCIPPEHADTWARVITTVEDVTDSNRAAAALRESEALLRQAAEMSNLGHWVWDEVEDRCLSCSETLARMNGVSVEEYFEKYPTMEALLADVHPDDRDRYEQTLATAREEAQAYDIEFRDAAPDGGYRYVRERSEPILDSKGKLVRSVGTFQDISEYKQSEEALRESEARLRDLIEGSIEGIMIHRDQKPLLVNDAWAAIHGYTVEEIFEIDSVFDLVSPRDRERLSGYRDARLRGEAAPERYEYRALRKDGSGIWLEHLVRAVDWGGAPAIQTVVIDISERKSAEAALERARDELERRVEERTRELHATNRALEEEVGTRKDVEERLRESERDLGNLIEGSVLGVVIVTEERRPRFANQAYAEIFGYDSPAEILALDNTLGLVAPHEVARLDALRKPIFAGDEAPISYEIDGIRKDGATIRLQCMARAMTWRGERVAQITLYDITELKRAERALQESEARLSSFINNIPNSIYLKDMEGRYVLVNESAMKQYGLPGNRLIGKTVYDIHPKDEADATIKQDREVLKQGLPIEAERELTFPDGSKHTVIAVKFPVRGESGEIIGIGGINIDITERKRVEEALRESDARLRQATELAGLGHCIWDSVADKCLFCSEDYARIHGVTPEEFISRASTQGGGLNHPDDRDAYRAAIAALRRGKPFEMEYRVITPEGEVRYVREAAKPIFDESGAVAQEICTIQDITERRKAEETVRTRDLWLRAILENAPIQIALKDTAGRIMAISRSAGEMLGVTVDELIGRTTADFLPQQAAEVYMATDREVVATGRSIQQEVVEDWDGSTRHFLNSKFPLRDDDGQIVGVCSLTSDITEAKLAEDRLRQAQKMEAVGQLTGGVAHDFNNLLAVILGNAEMLGERLGTEDRQVAAVMRAAARGAELTQRLLAFSRRQPLKPQAIDLADRVAGMTELLTRTLGATIEISAASMPGLWRASADPGQLENALLNLAINARDAMPEGGRLSISSANASLEAGEIAALLADQAPEAALEAATGEPGNPGDYVVLSVSDTGTGMSAAVLARVFEPFFTTKEVGQGSGLGLSMVYGFARQSGGFAAIESAPGRGTTVRLYLPRAVAAAPAPGARNRAGQLPRGHDETVLLIEDTQDVRELAVALLEDLGYRVLAAADAAEAGAQLAENPDVDLLLTDVILPGGRSGPDFAETARRHNPALKVLFMSGYPAEVLMERGDSLSWNTPLLPKPFRKAALAKAVREALDDGEEVQGAE